MNSAAIVSAQQHLQTHIATLWVHIGNAGGERHLQRTAREVLVRLNRLSVWIVEESSTRVVRDTLPLLFDIVDAAIETEARVDAMSNCLALVQEARGAVAPVRAKLNVHCEQLCRAEHDERAVTRLTALAMLCRPPDAQRAQDDLLRDALLSWCPKDDALKKLIRRESSFLTAKLASLTWHPAALAASLAPSCRRLTTLLTFLAVPSLLERWCAWQSHLCCAHFCRQPLRPEALEECCGFLVGLRYAFQPRPSASGADSDALIAEARNVEGVAECGGMADGAPGASAIDSLSAGALVNTMRSDDLPPLLKHSLHAFFLHLQPGVVSATVLRHAYELAVVSTQMDDEPRALVLRSFHAALAQHWFAVAPLSVELREVLSSGEWVLLRVPDAAGLARLLWNVSAHWPEAPPADLPIPLAEGGGAIAGSVRLDTVPVLLAGGLGTVTKAQRQWFASPKEYAAHKTALQRELLLLERGAAAIKVRSVERYTTRLLEFMVKADLTASGASFPGPLLWRALCHLVALLDAAAAWWWAEPDPALMAELREFGRSALSDGELDADVVGVAEGGGASQSGAWLSLGRRLTRYVESLSATLQVQMRLEVMPSGIALSDATLTALNDASQHLLRFLVLDFSLSLEARRVRHLPLTGCLWLSVAQEHPDSIQLTLRDDAAQQLPPPEQWQQLRYRVQRCGTAELTCDATALGRCFVFTLPRAPAQE